jgi:hypothetical protein
MSGRTKAKVGMCNIFLFLREVDERKRISSDTVFSIIQILVDETDFQVSQYGLAALPPVEGCVEGVDG